MLTEPIELDPVRSGADQDREVLTIYRGGPLVVAAAGVGSWYMAAQENITARERALGRVGAAVTMGLGVAAIVAPVSLAAVLRRRLDPWLLPAFGLAAVAKSGANRSPMFFPAVTLSALGGGRLGAFRWPRQTASGAMGVALGAGYGLVVLGVRRPWRTGWDMDLLWNLGVVPAFGVSPLVGGEMGDLALSMRRLERTRARDRHALRAVGAGRVGLGDDARLGRLRARLGRGGAPRAGVARTTLPELVDRVQAVSQQLENALLRIAAVPRAPEAMREVNEAVEEIRRGIEHHRLAPTLVSAARSRPGDLAMVLESVFAVYRSGWEHTGVRLTADTSGLPKGERADARVTSVLVRAAKVALDNAFEHGGEHLSAVDCSLALEADRLVLRVRDDGGAVRVPQEGEWGTGLTETAAAVRALGDDKLALRPVDGGVEFTAHLPRVPAADGHDGTYDSVIARVDDALDRCASYLMPSNYWAGVMGCLTAGRRGWRRAVAFSALVALDRAWARRVPGDYRRSAATTLAMGLLWPTGGLPAGGWIGAELFFQVVRSPPRRALGISVAATTALALRGLRVRGSIERVRLVESLVFSPFCAVAGLAPRYLRGRLQRIEAEALSLRERADLIETLARAARLDHDITKPLRASAAWYDDGIKNSADGQLLLKLSGDLDELAHELLAHVEIADPILDIQQHLQMRLDPVSVAVTGQRPVGVARSEHALQRAREHLATVALADQLADRLLQRFPPNVRGRSRLADVHVDISPADEAHVRVLVRPRPPSTSPDDDLGGLVSTLIRLDGTVEEGFEDGALSFTMAASTVSGR